MWRYTNGICSLFQHGTELGGRWLKIVIAHSKPAFAGKPAQTGEPSNTLFMGNLPFSIDEDTVYQFFDGKRAHILLSL